MKTVKTPNDFQEIQQGIIVDEKYDWLLRTQHVAKGYAISSGSVTKHIQRNPEEFLEGKHFIRGVDNLSTPYKNSQPRQVFWTKRGIIRLGFFIKTQQAKKFRDWAEDLTISAMQQQSKPGSQNLAQALRDAIEPIYDRLSVIESKVLGDAHLKESESWTQQVKRIMQSAGVSTKKEPLFIPSEIIADLPLKSEAATLMFISSILKACSGEKGRYTKTNKEIENEFKITQRTIGKTLKMLTLSRWIEVTYSSNARIAVKITDKTKSLYLSEKKEI